MANLKPYIATAAIAFLVLLPLSIFVASSLRTRAAAMVGDGLVTMLGSESIGANPFLATQSIEALQRSGFVECASLVIADQDPRTFIDFSETRRCRLLQTLFGDRYHRDFLSNAGNPWVIVYRTTSDISIFWAAFAMFCGCLVAIASLELVVRVRMRQARLIHEAKARSLLAFTELAADIAHDIRAPLAALKIATSQITNLDPDHQILIDSATMRIRDVAAVLLNRVKEGFDPRYPEETTPQRLTIESIPALINEVVRERMVIAGPAKHSQIKCSHTLADQLQARVDKAGFQRVISNLLENSVQAINETGFIQIVTAAINDKVVVTISDNGIGIPAKTLRLLGRRGATFNKQGGFGIGLFSAKRLVEEWSGSLTIDSTPGVGTMVTLSLPILCKHIEQKQLTIRRSSKLAIVDDDPSVHSRWRKKFTDVGFDTNSGQIRFFDNLIECEAWIRDLDQNDTNWNVIIDHCFSNSLETGFEFVQRTGTSPNSYLVTNRHDDPALRHKCTTIGLRVLAKAELEELDLVVTV